MPILSKEQARTLLNKVLSYSKADECEVNLTGTDGGNVRYARNAVSTSGIVSESELVVQSAFGKKLGTATINEFDDASLEKVVRRAEELAQLAPENPEYIGVLGPQKYADSKTFVQSTASITPAQRSKLVEDSLKVAKESKAIAAGFLEDKNSFAAMMNSKGLFAYKTSTNANFSITARTEDGKGSGYAIRGYNDIAKLDTKAATRIATDKAARSAAAQAIEPGKYTVILEPAAVAVLFEFILFNMDARDAYEGTSFLSKPGGQTRLGEKMVDERVNIYSDPSHPDLPTSPWSADGRPHEKVSWIEKGAVTNLTWSRYWAEKKGQKAIPTPDAAIMEGGTKSLEELIKGTKKGILITRLWYIRTVDPQSLLLTGLTRDGTFYIENGKIKYPVKNFRFNESPIIMLNNLEELGIQERTVSAQSNNNFLLPSIKVRDFTFSSLSDAV
jgi:predicted Zn-dependent protease